MSHARLLRDADGGRCDNVCVQCVWHVNTELVNTAHWEREKKPEARSPCFWRKTLPGDCLVILGVGGGGGLFWPSWDLGRPTHPPEQKLFSAGEKRNLFKDQRMQGDFRYTKKSDPAPPHPPKT